MNNRIIKFRVWDKVNKKFEDSLNAWRNDCDELYLPPIAMLQAALKGLQDNDNYILQQFTDLLDKNGKEIFEGDIIFVQDGQLEFYVTIEWGTSGWKADTPGGHYAFLWMDWYEKFEVAGNILENPELIKS